MIKFTVKNFEKIFENFREDPYDIHLPYDDDKIECGNIPNSVKRASGVTIYNRER